MRGKNMVLKIGDKGPVVQFINSYFNILGDEYTQETENRVKQFQQSYKQIYRTDVLTPYPTENIEELYTKLVPNNSDGYDVKISTVLPVLWPNGKVDIKTMTAILDTDVEYFDFQKVLAVRRALNITEYSDYGNIFLMLCEMALDLNFRLDNNLDFVPLLVDKTIKRVIGADTLVYGGSDQEFSRDDLVDYHLAEFKIHGNNILSGDTYRTKKGTILDLQDISESDKNLYSIRLKSTNDLKLLEGTQSVDTPLNIPEKDIELVLLGENQYGKIRFEETLRGLEGRQSGSTYLNNNANFKIIPGDFDEPLNIPSINDYIPENKRAAYFNTNGNPIYIVRDIKSPDDSFNLKEYIIWMNDFYRISKIDKITTSTSGYKVDTIQNKGNSTRVLYLCCADEDDSVEINNFGIYTDYKKIDVNAPGLRNINGVQDIFEVISGKYEKYSYKLNIPQNVSFTTIYDSEKDITAFKIQQQPIYGVNVDSIICNVVTTDPSNMPLLEYNDGIAGFTFIFPGNQGPEIFTNFLNDIYGNGNSLDIYYVLDYADYYFNNPTQVNIEKFRYIRTNHPDITITAQYKLMDGLELVNGDISGPNPYYAPKLSGVGEDGYIRVYSVQKNGEAEITSLPTPQILYGIGDITDYWDVTAGKLVKNIDSVKLNGDELSIDLITANNNYTVFGITNIMPHRAISFAGFSNYFLPGDKVLSGEEQGFSYDTASPQNIYISIDNNILAIGNGMSVEVKISKLRNWLRQCYVDGNPVTFLWVLGEKDNIINTSTYKIPQFRYYTRIYNNYGANMEIRLHVVVDLHKGEIVLAGLYEEGPIDLSEKFPSYFENDVGFYDSHLIKAIRLYQKTHDIGQDTEFGRYYSGVLDVPTYNAIKLEFGLQEEVIG